MPFYDLVLALLVTWRVTHLLNAEHGPGDIFARMRKWAGDTFWGRLLDCFYCLSLWVSAPLAVLLGQQWKERLLLWPALSGAAILLERFSEKPQPAAPPFFKED
jgi:hypothetical protein